MNISSSYMKNDYVVVLEKLKYRKRIEAKGGEKDDCKIRNVSPRKRKWDNLK